LRLALLLMLPVLLLSACGEEQASAPDVFDVKVPEGSKRTEFETAGMTLERPTNWKLRRRDQPGVFELSSGEAIVAGWAYPRAEPLPRTDAELEAARSRLLEAIERRDPRYRVLRVRTREVGGAPAIDIRGEQVISKRRLRTRSIHAFAGEVEYVIEAIAPPGDNRVVATRVLRPMLRSLELEGEVAEETP
jgi:hypothetical protein